jgi:hypothetical protein
MTLRAIALMRLPLLVAETQVLYAAESGELSTGYPSLQTVQQELQLENIAVQLTRFVSGKP